MAAAAAAATAATPPPDSSSDPLAVLLGRPGLLGGDQMLLCTLLRASKALAAAVRARGGQLTVRFSAYTTDKLDAFLPWLAKHGAALGELQLELHLPGSAWHEGEAALAAALQRAAGTSQWAMLQLRAFAMNPTMDGVLSYLPEFYLTRLHLGPRASYSAGFALEQLTRLRSLALQGDSADNLAPSLASMTSLSHLALHGIAAASVPKLSRLPAQLQVLHVSLGHLRRSEAPPRLRLGHLTALTELSSEERPLVVTADDELPRSLRVLRVRDVLSPAPLLHCAELRVLHMHLSTLPADGLRALAAGLPALSDVLLCYSDMCDAAVAAAAPGWAALPLHSLDFKSVGDEVPGATLLALSSLSALTSLEVHGNAGCCQCAGVFDASPAVLADVLRRLTALEHLSLRGIQLGGPEAADARDGDGELARGGSSSSSIVADGATPSASASSSSLDSSASAAPSAASAASSSSSSSDGGVAELMAAIAGLPALHQLTLCGVSGGGQEALLASGPDAAAALSHATQLTRLVLVDVGLDDASVNRLASCLTGLRALKLDANPLVTHDALPPDVAAQLRCLKELCVLRTGIRLRARSFKARLESLHPGLTVKSCAR